MHWYVSSPSSSALIVSSSWIQKLGNFLVWTRCNMKSTARTKRRQGRTTSATFLVCFSSFVVSAASECPQKSIQQSSSSFFKRHASATRSTLLCSPPLPMSRVRTLLCILLSVTELFASHIFHRRGQISVLSSCYESVLTVYYCRTGEIFLGKSGKSIIFIPNVSYWPLDRANPEQPLLGCTSPWAIVWIRQSSIWFYFPESLLRFYVYHHEHDRQALDSLSFLPPCTG